MKSYRFGPALCLAMLFSAGNAFAFGSGDDRGAVGFKSLALATGARAAALGGSDVTISGDPTTVTSNPAAAATITTRAAGFGVTNYVLDIVPANGTMVYPTPNGTYSVTLRGVSYGDFDRIDPVAADDGSFGASDVSFGVGYARYVKGVAVGVNAGMIRSTIDSYSASAVVFSAGLLWELPERGTAVGVSVVNAGTALNSYLGGGDGMKDEVPTAFHLGARHRPQHFPVPLTLYADVEIPRDDETTASVGAEITPIAPLSIRLGYDSLVRYASGTVAEDAGSSGIVFDDGESSSFGGTGFRAGFGLDWQQYGIDYAYVPAGPFGSIHHLTARVTW